MDQLNRLLVDNLALVVAGMGVPEIVCAMPSITIISPMAMKTMPPMSMVRSGRRRGGFMRGPARAVATGRLR